MSTNSLPDPSVIWESPDKLFTKTLLSKGYGFNAPQDGSVCKIKVVNDVSKILTEVDGDEIKELIVGDVDDPIDKIVEACIRTMKDEEVCNLKFYHPSYHAQVKAKESHLEQVDVKDEKENSVVESPVEENQVQKSSCISENNFSDNQITSDVSGNNSPDKKTTSDVSGNTSSDKKTTSSVSGNNSPDKKTTSDVSGNTSPGKKTTSDVPGNNSPGSKTNENEVTSDNLENNKIGFPIEIQSLGDSSSASSSVLENTICDKIQDCLAIESNKEANNVTSKESSNCNPVADLEESPGSHSSEAAHTPTMLEVDLQLLSYTREPEIWEMSITEKWRRANYHKQKGMDLYARGSYEWAFRRFGLALKYIISLEHDIPSGHEEGMNITGLKLSCYLNVAACQMRHYNFESVIKNCTKAIALQPNNAKALYRRGSAYLQLQEFDKAKMDLNKAQELEPKNPAIAKQQQLLKVQVQKLNQYYASAMKKMFS